MEEFVKNIWTAEESHVVTTAVSGVEATAMGSTLRPSSSGVQKQEGGLSLPKNLTCKTADEVWKEIHQATNPISQTSPSFKKTMGKITLEDFLTKTGIKRDEMDVEPSTNSDNSAVTVIGSSSQVSQVSPSQADWLSFQLKGNMPHQRLRQYQHRLVHPGQHGNQYYVDAPMAFPDLLVSPVAVGLSSSTISNGVNCPKDLGSNNLSYAVSDRKHLIESHDDQSFDRRQKRMIKNRESAARSRARKQAYTIELESEVSLLKEENAKLFQQQVEMTRKRRKELMEMLVPVTSSVHRPKHNLCTKLEVKMFVPVPSSIHQPKHNLRRTLSTSW